MSTAEILDMLMPNWTWDLVLIRRDHHWDLRLTHIDKEHNHVWTEKNFINIDDALASLQKQVNRGVT